MDAVVDRAYDARDFVRGIPAKIKLPANKENKKMVAAQRKPQPKPSPERKPERKPEAKKLAPPTKLQTKQKTSSSWSFSMPTIPKSSTGAIDVGTYATLGFATSLLAAAMLSVGVRASRKKRARRRAERQARLEADKLRQKDRWATAIDTDTVTRDVAERAERIATAEATSGASEDAPDAERAELQKAYDEFLRATSADKKL